MIFWWFISSSSFVFLTVWPLNQSPTVAQRNSNKKVGRKSFSGCWLELVRSVVLANFQIWKLASTKAWSFERAPFSDLPEWESNFMFLRCQHDFKIQLPLYFLQLDWLIRSFPSNLYRRTRTDISPENHGEIWIKTVNIGDLWSRMKRSKTQCNIGAGKEII